MLEEQHPDLQFDWPQILETPAPAVEPEEGPGGRLRRLPREGGARASRPPARIPAPPARREPLSEQEAAGNATVDEPPPGTGSGGLEGDTRPPAARRESAEPSPPMPGAALEPPRFTRVFDAEPAGQTIGEPVHRASALSAAEQLLGAERLALLRARYAELLAAIQMRGGDPARQQMLREQAERVNPDAWVTEQEVRSALPGLEATFAELRGLVGRRRRRRRRAGPRSAGEPGTPSGSGPEPDSGPDESSPEPDDRSPSDD